MSHLLPSSSVLGGFLAGAAPGLGGLTGGLGALPPEAVGAAASLKLGFLCVFWESSTFFNPVVTEPPLLSCAKTASMPPPPLPLEAGAAAPDLGAAGADGAGGAGAGGAGGALPCGTLETS